MTHSDLLAAMLAPSVAGDTLEARRIFIRGLVLDIVIGVHAHEQVRTQQVAIDVDLYLAPVPPPSRDALEEVLNYEEVREAVRQIALRERFKLLESLAERVAAECLANFGVTGVRVGIEKLEIFEDAKGVGFELIRFKST